MSQIERLSQLLRRTLTHIVISGRGSPPTRHSISEHRTNLLTIRNRRDPNLELYLRACDITIESSELRSEFRDFLSSVLSEYIHDGRIQVATIGISGGLSNRIELDNLIKKLLELAIIYEPDRAAQMFIAATEDDQCRFQEYTLLGGVNFDSSLQLYDGVMIISLPNQREQLPTNLPYTFLDSQLEDRFIGGTVLVEDWTVKPRFMNPQEFLTETSLDGDFPFVTEMCSSLSPTFNSHEFCNALSLIAKTTVFASVQWKYLSEDEIANCMGMGGGMSYRDEPTLRSRTDITTDQLTEAMNLYETLMHLAPQDRTRIAVPIDRLIASWGSKGYVDQIIDLAIALESLYLPDGEAELAHRLRIRGARYLESDFERRRQLANHLKVFYGVRSRAIHTGKVPNTHTMSTVSALQLLS